MTADRSPGGDGGRGLIVERRGAVAWLIFDRPDRGNAMDAGMLAALPRAWRELDGDDTVRAIVVTGNGAAFQTGLDMAALAMAPATLREASRKTKAARLELTGWHLGVRTPVLAAVNGVCAGGGLHFVLDADVVIAARTARFLDPHVSVGQASAWEAVGLMHRVPASVASELVLGGRFAALDADRAYRVGLVSEVVEADRLRARVQELAEFIADAEPELVRARKAALWSALEHGRTEMLRRARTSTTEGTVGQ